MSATTTAQRIAESTGNDALNERFAEAMQRGTFASAARAARRFSDAEDRLQEALSLTWLAFRRWSQQYGEYMKDGLLAFIARRHVVSPRSHFVPRERRREHTDVYEPRALRAGVVHGELHQHHGATRDPHHQLTTRMDLHRFAASLTSTDRRVLLMAGHGATTCELATELHVSPATAHRRLQRLRASLQQEVLHG